MDRRQLLKQVGVIGGIGIGGIVMGGQLTGGANDDGDRTTSEPPDDTTTAERTETATTAERTETTTSEETTTSQEPPVRHADAFGTVVNAVEAGADPEGKEPVNGVFERHAGDDTLFAFPEGTYRLRPIDLSGYTNFGIAAAHEERPTFVSAPGECLSGGNSYVLFGDVDGLLIDAVDFDFTVENSGGVVRVFAAGDATVRDVSIAGGCNDQVTMFRMDVLDEAGTGVVENLRMVHENADMPMTGMYVGEEHAGEVTFRDCEISGLSDNGLYASAPGLESGRGGTVHVEGGTYRNNNIANVRLGSDESTARGVEIISNELPPPNPNGPKINVRGLRLRNGRNHLVEDCSFVLTQDSGFSFGALVFHPDNVGATVRDTTVEINRDETSAIRALPRSTPGEGSLTFENVAITGNAADDITVLIEGRDETTFRNCTIEQSGKNRSGIHLWDSADCRIIDSRIDVTKHPLVLRNSNAAIRNTTFVTPDGSQHVEELEATGAEFTPHGRT